MQVEVFLHNGGSGLASRWSPFEKPSLSVLSLCTLKPYCAIRRRKMWKVLKVGGFLIKMAFWPEQLIGNRARHLSVSFTGAGWWYIPPPGHLIIVTWTAKGEKENTGADNATETQRSVVLNWERRSGCQKRVLQEGELQLFAIIWQLGLWGSPPHRLPQKEFSKSKTLTAKIFIIDVEPFLNYIYCTSSGNLRYFIANVGILRRQISANHSSLNILFNLKNLQM